MISFALLTDNIDCSSILEHNVASFVLFGLYFWKPTYIYITLSDYDNNNDDNNNDDVNKHNSEDNMNFMKL